ncbi:MAG: metallopeptidase family protein [Candidatus Sulfotelmatobacter sp.]
MSQSHSECCCLGGGFAAEPAISEAGATRSAASGRLSWRAHHQEDIFDMPSGPDHIVLYQKNVEAVCSSEAEVREQIRLTVIREMGHYLGMDENQRKDVWATPGWRLAQIWNRRFS